MQKIGLIGVCGPLLLLLYVQGVMGWKEPRKSTTFRPPLIPYNVTSTYKKLARGGLAHGGIGGGFSHGGVGGGIGGGLHGGIGGGGGIGGSNHYPGHLSASSVGSGHGHGGSQEWQSLALAFDLPSALVVFGATVIFISLSTLIYPLVANRRKNGKEEGWERKSDKSDEDHSRSYHVAGLAGTVLKGVERFMNEYGQ